MSEAVMATGKPLGRALIVGAASLRVQPVSLLQRLGFECAELDDPYTAMVELCRRPLVYRSLVIALNSLYKQEIQIIRAVKSRFPHIEVWLSGIEGRQAALAEAIRLGADGLLADDGLHRMSAGESSHHIPAPEAAITPQQVSEPQTEDDGSDPSDPVLTAEELQALLQEEVEQSRRHD